MTRKQALSSSTRLTLAAVVAAGLVAAPVAFGPGAALHASSAAAQAQADDEGYAQERTERRLDAQPTEADEETIYRILGTTREEAEAADTTTSATAQYGQLAAYQTEVERGNLDAAAEKLAAIAEDPITEDMVSEVNTELGVETTLTAKQIADAAARKQDEGS